MVEPSPRTSKMPEQKPGRSRQDYGTPKELLTAVQRRLKVNHFTVDLAASHENTVCELYFTEECNSLAQNWLVASRGGWAWLNPPFADLAPWVTKAAVESATGAHIAMLVPSSVGSNWWKKWVEPFAYVAHLTGRLTFVGETTPYPKDCSLLFYQPGWFVGSTCWDWRAE